MAEPKTSCMRAILHEHNTLNGFWFSLIEFILVALAALALAVIELAHGKRLWSFGYCGIGANAAAICATVIEQMRRGERDSNLAATYFGAGRSAVKRDHPALDVHTLQIVVATLVPFVMVVPVAREWLRDRDR